MTTAKSAVCLLTLSVVCATQAIDASFRSELAAAKVWRAEDVFEVSGNRRGLFVVVGDDAKLALELASAEPVIMFVVTAPEKLEETRKRIVEAGLHGRVTAATHADGRLPLIDNLAALVVADLDTLPQVKREECLRVVRPRGKLLTKRGGRWGATEKPRPEGVDDWPQYHHDAAMTDRSDDMLAGPAEGIQWLAGDNSIQPAKMGARVVGSLILHVDERGVAARDAYSGLPVWRRVDLKPSNRYSFLADDQRVYLIPRKNDRSGALPSHMAALDLQTGKDVLTYTEGIKLGWAMAGITPEENKKLERTDRGQSKRNRARAEKSYDSAQVRLANGVLLQTRHGEMVALDAATGRRLWSQALTGESLVRDPRRKTEKMASHTWHHPMVLDGRVYAVEGEPAPSWSYTHWPMGAVRAVHCFDLETGAKQWAWSWPDTLGEPAAAYNMTPVGEYLGLMLRTRAFEKSPTAIVFVKRDGTSYKYVDEAPYGGAWGKGIGGGHSHARILFVDGKVWVNGTTKPSGAIDLDQPDDKASWDMRYAKLPRPVGCTVTRATPNYVFGSLTTYSLRENAIRHTNAARAVCDVGAIPAAGMTFITPTQCFCAPYLPASTWKSATASSSTVRFRARVVDPVNTSGGSSVSTTMC